MAKQVALGEEAFAGKGDRSHCEDDRDLKDLHGSCRIRFWWCLGFGCGVVELRVLAGFAVGSRTKEERQRRRGSGRSIYVRRAGSNRRFVGT